VSIVALPCEDQTVTAYSTSSTSAITDTEVQGERRKRGRPKKLCAPPFLDGVEGRQDSQIAAKRGRPKQVRGPGGVFSLQSVESEHPEIDVEPEDPVQPPAEPVFRTHARDGAKSSCSTRVQRREGTTRVVPNYGVVRRPFPVQPPLDPMAPLDVREGNKIIIDSITFKKYINHVIC
jgi:hypothetical protein